MKKDININVDVLIDDILWGSPIGSILSGIYSFKHDKFLYEVIDIKHCQSPNFERKTYLTAMADAALKMVVELNIEKTARILVCRGFVNNGIPDMLKSYGYMNVSRGVVMNPLQDFIEDAGRKYINSLGFGSPYDPKGMASKAISKAFGGAVNWIVENNRFDLAKTGWSYFRDKKYSP